jgi:hypothetical protein
MVADLAVEAGWEPGLWSLLRLVADLVLDLMVLVVLKRIGWSAAGSPPPDADLHAP